MADIHINEREQHLPTLISKAFGVSTSEGRRLISQGGVSLNGRPTGKLDVILAPGRSELAVGRRAAGVRLSADVVVDGHVYPGMPTRIAVCCNPNGQNMHVELEADEKAPTRCFEPGCDCHPILYIRAAAGGYPDA